MKIFAVFLVVLLAGGLGLPAAAADADATARAVPAAVETTGSAGKTDTASKDSGVQNDKEARKNKKDNEAPEDNGIRVGEAKVYDDRSLSIMLAELESRLASINAINAGNVVAGLDRIQSASSKSTSTTLQLTSPIQPAVNTTEAAQEGQLAVTERTTTTTELKPAPPERPDSAAAAPALPAFTPGVGLGAEDTLANQVNLAYQIYNLRMVLERAVSDRIDGGVARSQAVLAVPVSIDPPGGMHDRAAYVEIALNPLSDNGKPCQVENPHVSLVSMMPLEKTYNAMALSKKANAFGGSAVMSVLTLGLAHSSESQNLYVYRDIDTMALQFPSNKKDELRFGWAFKPVLGRRSIAPGMRQMLAVVSVTNAASDSCGAEALAISARSYWRRYDAKRFTTATYVDKEVATAPLGSGTLHIPRPGNVSDLLEPQVDNVIWTSLGANRYVASIRGKNFFPGTQVMLGNRVYADAASGLQIKSEIAMEIRGELKDLAFGQAYVSGRYDGGEALSQKAMMAASGSGIGIQELGFPLDRYLQSVPLRVVLGNRDGSPLLAAPKGSRLLLTVGEHVLDQSYDLNVVGCSVRVFAADGRASIKPTSCLQVEALVPGEWLDGDVSIGVRIPFMPAQWSDSRLSYRRQSASFAVLAGGATVRLALGGSGASSKAGWKMRVGTGYAATDFIANGALLLFDVPATALADVRTVIVSGPGVSGLTVDMPPLSSPADSKVSIDDAKTAPLAVNYLGVVALSGKNLDRINKVEFGGKELVFQLESNSKLNLVASEALTKSAGNPYLVLRTNTGEMVSAAISVR